MSTMRRVLASIILLAAIAAAVTAAVRWKAATADIDGMLAEHRSLASQMDTTRAALHKTSLRYQGFMKGTSAIPDSLRKIEAGNNMKQSTAYRKAILILEENQRRIDREITRIEKRLSRAREERRKAALVVGVPAGVLLGLALILFMTGRTRRVAP